MIRNLIRFLNPRLQRLYLEHRVNLSPRYGHGRPPHPELQLLIESGRGEYKAFADKLLAMKERFRTIKDSTEETDPASPAWNNGYLPGLDIIALYAMIYQLRPARFVEIGSGNSTKVARKAVAENELDTKLVSVDPLAGKLMAGITDILIRQPLEKLDVSIITSLTKNDILFIDGTHRILPNSDCTVIFMEILPKLKNGVVVHFHDVYLPCDYPGFMCDRFYSEQYGLAMLLLSAPLRYRIMFPAYFASQDEELSRMILPVWQSIGRENIERHGGSFWIRINETE